MALRVLFYLNQRQQFDEEGKPMPKQDGPPHLRRLPPDPKTSDPTTAPKVWALEDQLSTTQRILSTEVENRRTAERELAAARAEIEHLRRQLGEALGAVHAHATVIAAATAAADEGASGSQGSPPQHPTAPPSPPQPMPLSGQAQQQHHSQAGALQGEIDRSRRRRSSFFGAPLRALRPRSWQQAIPGLASGNSSSSALQDPAPLREDDDQSEVTYDDISDELSVARQMNSRYRRDVLYLQDALNTSLQFVLTRIDKAMDESFEEAASFYRDIPDLDLVGTSNATASSLALPALSDGDASSTSSSSLASAKSAGVPGSLRRPLDWRDFYPMEYVHRQWECDSEFDSDTDDAPQERSANAPQFAWWRFTTSSGAFEGMQTIRRKTSRSWELAKLEAEMADAAEAEDRVMARRATIIAGMVRRNADIASSMPVDLFALEDMDESDEAALVPETDAGDVEMEPAGPPTPRVLDQRPHTPAELLDGVPVIPSHTNTPTPSRGRTMSGIAGSLFAQTPSWLKFPGSGGGSDPAAGTGAAASAAEGSSPDGSAADLTTTGAAPSLGWFDNEGAVDPKAAADEMHKHLKQRESMLGLRWEGSHSDPVGSIPSGARDVSNSGAPSKGVQHLRINTERPEIHISEYAATAAAASDEAAAIAAASEASAAGARGSWMRSLRSAITTATDNLAAMSPLSPIPAASNAGVPPTISYALPTQDQSKAATSMLPTPRRTSIAPRLAPLIESPGPQALTPRERRILDEDPDNDAM
ncbi:hypothetical protein HK105_207982 [Polyrhizophydium stewartii]|uniref:Uncharacterized protein n=1 Tax=Polyrhizophydium stewartii TaxID=2732419 RepID=A0ABR4MYY2_9FUNG